MANSKFHILVAEDDHFLRKVYMTKLTQEGFKVDVAVDGEEALKKMQADPPELILLDIVMPKMNGFDVLEEMKKDPKLNAIPVIVLSNLGQSEDIQRARELGARDYLVKANFSINEVVTKIRNFLSQAATKQAAAPAAKPAQSRAEKTGKIYKKTLTKCDHCNKTIPQGAKFCPYCGEELVDKSPAKKIKVKKV